MSLGTASIRDSNYITRFIVFQFFLFSFSQRCFPLDGSHSLQPLSMPVVPASSVLTFDVVQLVRQPQQKESCTPPPPVVPAIIAELIIGPTWIMCPSPNQLLCLEGCNILISRAKSLAHSYMGEHVGSWQHHEFGDRGGVGFQRKL